MVLTVLNSFGSFLHSLLAFVIILVPLVVFHEFGHFIMARLFNVKAEVFSVGFGPRIWGRQWGETEFRISAIPLGGYVKLLGEDRDANISEVDLGRTLLRQKPWKRFFIYLGGPLFNFILAVFIFMTMMALGEPQVASVIGRVVKASQAEKLGFQSGDLILELDHKPVKRFDEVFYTLNENPGKVLDFTILHPGGTKPVTISAQTTSHVGYSIYGESTAVGDIDGLVPAARSNIVGISDSASIAGKAGILTGDKILSINKIAVSTWEEIEGIYAKITPGSPFELAFEPQAHGQKKKGGVPLSWVKPAASLSLGDDFGLHSSELFVEKTVEKSPAQQGGVKAGDRLVAIGGQVVQSFFELKEAVQKSGEKEGKVELVGEREGKKYTLHLIPTATQTRDQVLNPTVQYTIGVMPQLVFAEPATFIERTLNPFTLIYKATERVVSFSWKNFVSLRKMITGAVSMGTIGGPISIGKIAGESLRRGLFAFLTSMAVFSIGLGVLNILPVPVLDGGQLLLLGIEMIRGKQLTLRQMEIVQGVGLILILALMGVAFHNDLARLFYS
ncbi:MAG: RIP metalloprotease RseP [Bdellovibrio sp.]|nr:RIP metalloprotease RseP [Bdellovibrio sp.]